MNTNYNDYNGRISETIIETFIKKTGFLVQKFGVENQFGTGIDLLNSTNNVIEKGKGNIVKYMTLPDFTAIKVNSNGDMEQVYFIDSKYRSYDNKQHLIRELKKMVIFIDKQRNIKIFGIVKFFYF